MALRRSSHAVYDTQYHLVWSPKYRKGILRGEMRERVAAVFREVGEAYDYEIAEVEVAADHVHLLLSFPPRYSIAQVVGALKSLSARVVFREFPEVRQALWGGELWEDGYFVRTVGDRVTARVIQQYIQAHRSGELHQVQPGLFEDLEEK